MNSLFALTIIFVIYAIGDIVSTKTHAIVSMLLIISVIFALAFWNNWLPGTIFTDSNLKAFGDVTVGLLLVHIGTTIHIRDFIEQYKTVIIVLCSTLAICIGVYFISKIFIERELALVATPLSAARSSPSSLARSSTRTGTSAARRTSRRCSASLVRLSSRRRSRRPSLRRRTRRSSFRAASCPR